MSHALFFLRWYEPCACFLRAMLISHSNNGLGVFLSKITELLARSNRRALSVTFVSFSGILRGRMLLMVFCGSRDLSMLHNQFSLPGEGTREAR